MVTVKEEIMTKLSTIVCVVILSAVSVTANATHPAPLPDTITTPNNGYIVNFTDNNSYNPNSIQPGDDLNYMPTGQAQNMANALDNNNVPAVGNPNGYHAGYTGFGFLAPTFTGGTSNIFTFDCGPHGGCDSGDAPADMIRMPSTTFIQSSERNIRRVIGHELFHHVQYSYITFGQWLNWGRTAVEGTARMMEDKTYSDIDSDSTLRYLSQVNSFLGAPNQDIWQASYSAALFWNYLTEQFGSAVTEPQVGVDFMTQFWANAQTNNASPDTVATVRDTINDFDVSATLEDTFHDFTIANYAKDMDVTALPDAVKYRYIDENDGNGISYNPVATAWSGSIPPQKGPTAASISRWGAKYYEATVGVDCAGILGFLGDGDTAAYSLLAISGTDTIERVYKGVTGHFAKSLIQRSGADRYTRLVAVVAGFNDSPNFDYTFDCGFPKMAIKRPVSSNKAYVGDPAEPDTFLIRLLVTGLASLGDPTVEGLDKTDFSVFVGDEVAANEATVLSGANVQGEYWIVAQAPAKPATGTFPLLVKLGDLVMDTTESSVIYEKLILDQVLVIDRSGSMLSPTAAPKLNAAKNAAALFVDAAHSYDKLGVISFGGDNVEPNDDSTLELILDDATDTHRDDARIAIQNLSTVPSVLTSIGDGLNRGAAEFPIRGSALGEDWLVLLSDGMENEARFWTDIRAAIISNGIRVNAIALGPQTDQPLLQSIAADTGGTYYYVDVGTVALASAAAESLTPVPAAAATLGNNLPNNLADAYATAAERIKRHERLWETAGLLRSRVVHSVAVEEGGIDDGQFAFNWGDAGEALQATVVRPDGTQVMDGVAGAQIFVGATHVVVQVGKLMPGKWTVILDVLKGSPDYIGMLSGKDRRGASMDIYYAQFNGDQQLIAQNGLFMRGVPQPILATLTDRKGVITGATLVATVEHPDGSTLDLPLLDDGGHGDGNANDGIYGNIYTRTTVASPGGLPDGDTPELRGSYNVRVEAVGKDNQGGAFTRIRKSAFQIFEGTSEQDPNPDIDKDRMPNRYELLHSCLNYRVFDAGDDPDQDGLISIEEFELGTDPCNADTDQGGESDLSEVKRGSNPFDPRDDSLPRPTDVEVVDWVLDHMPKPPLKPNTNLIRYPVNPVYNLIQVWRSSDPGGPFNLVAEFAPADQRGLYPDEGLKNNVAYYYQIVGVNEKGGSSAPSHVFSGTPKADPFPPIGGVMINHDQPFTESNLVTLQLRVDDADVKLVEISDLPDFSKFTSMSFVKEVDWKIVPNKQGNATVYVRFIDDSGNVSRIYDDSIQVQLAGSTGGIRAVVLLDGAKDHSGSMLEFVSDSGVPPAFTNGAGEVEVGLLLPAVMSVRASQTGYFPKTVTGVKVAPGRVTDIGRIILEPIDTDKDGVADIQDNCVDVPNGPLIPDAGGHSQRDTDGDGYGNMCDGDLNNDGSTNTLDLNLYKLAHRTELGDPNYNVDADFNGDGMINTLDLNIYKGLHRKPPGPSCCGLF